MRHDELLQKDRAFWFGDAASTKLVSESKQ